MTLREKAIVMAYTGIVMLTDDDFGWYYKYVQEKLGRPIMTHELSDNWAIRNAAADDFFALCKEDGGKGEWPEQ